MSGPGRNDPCPCGSGKKYKHCCLARAQSATGITPADRAEVFDALLRFTRRPEFDDVVAEAALLWMGAEPDEDPAEAMQAIFAHETSGETFFDWLFFDLALDEGQTIAAAYLERHPRALNPRALDYLRIMQGTHLRAWQVRHVQPGTGMTLRDLWSNEDVTITERSATQQVVVWDVFVARIVRHADGTAQIEGSALLLPARAAAAIVKGLKAEHRRARRTRPDLPLETFFKIKAPLFHLFWQELVAGAEPPEIRTTEGDAIAFSEIVFDVPQAGTALATILQQPDFEPGEPGEAVWIEPGGHPPRVLGEVSCRKGTLTLRTVSRERAARCRARIVELLGPLAILKEHYEAPDLTRAAKPRTPEQRASIDIDDVPELAAWREQQDRAWLDLDIPALEGKTPRQAAKDRRLKPRLVNLLIDIENREARMAAPKPGRDMAWMWRGLGLRRP